MPTAADVAPDCAASSGTIHSDDHIARLRPSKQEWIVITMLFVVACVLVLVPLVWSRSTLARPTEQQPPATNLLVHKSETQAKLETMFLPMKLRGVPVLVHAGG